MNKLSRRSLGFAFLVSLTIRVLCVIVVDYHLTEGDSVAYDRMGWNLVAHHVYSIDQLPPYQPTVVRAPLLPLEMAVVYSIVGHHPVAIQVVQVVFTSSLCVLLALAVQKIDPDVASWTLWLAALSPFDAVFAGAWLAEAVCTTSLVLAMTLPFILKRWRWLLAGIAFGLAALARDIYLLLPLFIALGALVRRRWRIAVSVAIGVCIAIAPWTARNWAATGRPVIVSKGLLWYNLWIGTWERNGDWELATLTRTLPPESYRFSPTLRPKVEDAIATLDVAQRENKLRELTLERWRSEPGRVFARCVARSYKMWVGTRLDLFSFRPHWLRRGSAGWWIVKIVFLSLDLAVVAMAAVGIALAIISKSRLCWFAVPIFYNQLIYFVFHNIEPRFTEPVIPFLLVFVAVLACRLTRWRGAETSISASRFATRM